MFLQVAVVGLLGSFGVRESSVAHIQRESPSLLVQPRLDQTSLSHNFQAVSLNNFNLQDLHPGQGGTYWHALGGVDEMSPLGSGVSFSSSFAYDGTWSGFVLSSVLDSRRTKLVDMDPGLMQFAAMAPISSNDRFYLICHASEAPSCIVSFATPVSVQSAHFTNSAYAFWSMQHGDEFSKRFGGTSGKEQDWFKLEVSGFINGRRTGSVIVPLADFRTHEGGAPVMLADWTKFDLSALGTVDYVIFQLTSSDTGGKDSAFFLALSTSLLPWATAPQHMSFL